ncbi:MAG TPA: acyl carrier protein [Tepidisphaeraceae bacterium]|jgi:acyl carrier protein
MGLEAVEIIMDVEDHFKVSVPDSVASKCLTVADLQRELILLLQQQGRQPSEELDREVYEGIVAIVVKQTGIPTSKIKPESRWIGDITKYG